MRLLSSKCSDPKLEHKTKHRKHTLESDFVAQLNFYWQLAEACRPFTLTFLVLKDKDAQSIEAPSLGLAVMFY